MKQNLGKSVLLLQSDEIIDRDKKYFGDPLNKPITVEEFIEYLKTFDQKALVEISDGCLGSYYINKSGKPVGFILERFFKFFPDLMNKNIVNVIDE